MKLINLMFVASICYAGALNAQNVDSLITEGRAYLAAHEIGYANAKFSAAVAASPSHETANALYGVTRLLALTGQPSWSGFLDRLGFPASGRNIYDWTSQIPRDKSGVPIAPTGVNASEVAAFLRTNALPAIDSAIANLGMVKSTNFILSLSGPETTTVPVEVDYGDILMLRSLLYAVEYFGYTVTAHNVDIQLTALRSLYTDEGPAVDQLLMEYPQLLTFSNTNDLALARVAFANAIDRYQDASAFIRSRVPGFTALFNLDDRGRVAEANFRYRLAALRMALDGATVLSTGKSDPQQLTLNSGGLFTGANPIRSMLPQFSGKRMILGTLPDASFGGIVVGFTPDEVESFLSDTHKHRLSTKPDAVQAGMAGPQSFHFTARVQRDRGYVVQASTNLLDWFDVSAFVATGATEEYHEAPTGFSPHRFYRVVDRTGNLPPPSNDNFANRTMLSGLNFSVPGYNIGATSEPGEPKMGSGYGVGQTVWWGWTAPTTGIFTVEGIPSSSQTFVPSIDLFTGSSVSGLTRIASGFYRVDFLATAGVAYQIASDGYVFSTPNSGGFRLVIGQAPTISITSPSDGATFSAPANVTIQVNASSPAGVSSVELDGIGKSVVIKQAPYTVTYPGLEPGTYYLAASVTDANGVVSDATVSFSVTSSPAAPVNDNFADRTVLTGSPITVTGFNGTATTEPGEQHPGEYFLNQSVWWTWTSPSNTVVSLDATGSSFGAVIAVYAGNALNSLQGVAYSVADYFSLAPGRLEFNAIAGVQYQIAVGSDNGDSGSIVLNLQTYPVVEPYISQHPASQTALLGGVATLAVTASGTGPLSYQWRKDGIPVAGATNSTLQLVNIQASDATIYDVVISNLAASVTSGTATLTIAPSGTGLAVDPSFVRPRLQETVRPGRLTAAPGGKLYASWMNGFNINSDGHQTVGAVIRLNSDGSLDDSFKIGSFLADALAVAVQTDGKILVGGVASSEFKITDNADANGYQQSLYRIWRFFDDGTLDESYHSPVFATLPRYIALQPDGRLLVSNQGGDTSEGVEVSNGGFDYKTLVRLNTDGSIDGGFNRPILDDYIFANIIVDGAGRILIGGKFTTVNGATVDKVARLNPDGTVDNTFYALNYTVSTQVRGLGLTSDGKLLVAGDLTVPASNSPNAIRPVIRLNSNGVLDQTFNLANAVDLGIYPGQGERARLLNMLPDGRFTIVSTTVARFNPDGTLDSTYSRPVFSSECFWMETLSDGRVVVPTEPGTTVNGQATTGPVRFNVDGSVDSTYTQGVFQTEEYPLDFKTLPDGRILAWGEFDTVNSVGETGVVRLQTNGLTDATLTTSGIPNLFGVGPAGVLSDGRIVAFTELGTPVLNGLFNGLSLFTTNGAVDSSFVPDASVLSIAQSDTLNIAVQPDNRIIVWAQSAQQVVNGGLFLRRLNTDGTVDTSFAGPTGNFGGYLPYYYDDPVFGDPYPMIAVGDFRILYVYSDGRLLVAEAAFDSLFLFPTGGALVRLNADGSVDSTFHTVSFNSIVKRDLPPVFDPPSQTYVTIPAIVYQVPVSGATVASDGSIMVYGSAGVMRLLPDGTVDATFGAGSGAGLNGKPAGSAQIDSLAITAGGKYLVTGNFDTFDNRGAAGIVRLNSNGSVDTTFATEVTFQPFLGHGTKIQVMPNGQVYLMGNYGKAGEAFPYGLTRLIPR